MMQERCSYVRVGDRLVHYRAMGSGPPLVMLHASPLSSKMLRPNMRAFASHFTCLALDNPGFGLSDPLPESQDDIFAYAEGVRDTIAALGLEKPIIYGVATGAAITHAFGCAYPDDAGLLMLDTFGHYDTDEMLKGYFPDVTPRRDGGHLLAYWEKMTGLFQFLPWQRDDAAHRQVRAMPPAEVVHDMVMQQLAAGPEYKHAYRAGIDWENKRNVEKLSAPVTLNVWPNASGIEKVRYLIERGLPKNYTPIYAEEGPAGRYPAQLDYLIEQGFHEGAPCPDLPSGDGDARSYVKTSAGPLHIQARHEADGRPILLLHDLAGSAAGFESLIDGIGAMRPIIAPDLPGHGDSLVEAGDLGAMAEILAELIDVAGASTIDVVGIGSSAALAALLKTKRPDSIGNIAYLASHPVGVDAASALPDLTPQLSGAHFIAAHSHVKRQAAFWNWASPTADQAIAHDNLLPPGALHQATFDLLRTRADLAALYAEAASASLNEDMLCLAPAWTVGQHRLPALMREQFAEVVKLPADKAEWPAAIAAAL